MTNILRKVMSIRNLNETASPPDLEDEDTVVDMEEPNDVGSIAIPNFAEEGVTDHTEILVELMHGPSVTVHIGKEAKLYTIPKRLLIYHSDAAAQLLPINLAKTGTEELILPKIHPHAFAHIYRWMHQDTLNIIAHCTRTSTSSGLQDACTLLCRIFAAAKYLNIPTLQDLAIEEWKTAFALARESGKVTPVLPSLVLEVWEECAGDEESLLWKVVLGEMCVAFSRKPLPVWAEFDVCCKRIDAFRLAVGGAMADRIVFGESGREEGGGKRIKLEVVSGGDEV